MILEIITKSSFPGIGIFLYEVFIYLVCAFVAFMWHDMFQRHKAKKYGFATENGIGIISQFKSRWNLLSVALLIVFGVCFKTCVPFSSDPGRKKSFRIGLTGVFWSFVASFISYSLLQTEYIVRDNLGISFFTFTEPWLKGFFSVFALISVFSLIFCLVPTDGGFMLASLAPYEQRDFLLNLQRYISVFVIVIVSAVLARSGFAANTVAKIDYMFEFVWTKLGNLIINLF